MRNNKTHVKVIHNAPKKKGKQEVRRFDNLEEALAWIEKNKALSLIHI